MLPAHVCLCNIGICICVCAPCIHYKYAPIHSLVGKKTLSRERTRGRALRSLCLVPARSARRLPLKPAQSPSGSAR